MATKGTHYNKRLQEIKEQEVIKEQIVFVGDCLVERFDLPRKYDDIIVYNHGIAEDTVMNLTDSLYKRVIKYKPSKVIISIGSHDLSEGNNVKDIYSKIVDIISTIQSRSKMTKIYVFSVTPVNIAQEPFIDQTSVSKINNKDVELLNYYLRNYTRKIGITFLDITKELKNDFYQLTLDYTSDGIHLNQEGYQVVKQMLLKYS